MVYAAKDGSPSSSTASGPWSSPSAWSRATLGSRAQLAAAAEGVLDGAEQRLLVRRAGGWTAADLALVDEARALVEEPPRAYGHVIVDEAQDLTPMQLRMVGRRVAGAFTLLGDIAQATGTHAYDSWGDLLPFLPGAEDAELTELEHAYRVPREIMAFSLPLVEAIAPGTRPPRAYRTGGEAPRVVAAADPFGAALAEAARLGSENGLVAVIAPLSFRGEEGFGSVFDDTRVPVITPREAKGLEFDHVVVVEPAAIVAEAGGRRGLRELYVALTRPTTTLVITHAEPLPPALAPPAGG